MTEYTPTPWKTDGVYIVAPLGPTIADCKRSPSMDLGTARANAAFIVKAVNSHEALVTELKLIADWRNVSLAGEYEHALRDIIRSMLDCADRALETIKVPS